MPTATPILPPSPFHNLSAGDLVDRLGAVKADRRCGVSELDPFAFGGHSAGFDFVAAEAEMEALSDLGNEFSDVRRAALKRREATRD